MVEPVARESDEELSLLLHQSNGDRSWRLNFDGFQLSPEHKDKKPPRSLHDCLGVLGYFHYLFFLLKLKRILILIY